MGRNAVTIQRSHTDVLGGLSANDLRRQRSQLGQIKSRGLGLLGEFWAHMLGSRGRGLFHRGLGGPLLLKRLLVLDLAAGVVGIEQRRAGLGPFVGEIAVGSHDCEREKKSIREKERWKRWRVEGGRVKIASDTDERM